MSLFHDFLLGLNQIDHEDSGNHSPENLYLGLQSLKNVLFDWNSNLFKLIY